MSPAERFAAIVATLVSEPGVTPPSDDPGSRRTFGSNGLKVNDKIFAMLVRGDFVVKLRPERVRALVAAEDGRSFDRGQGQPMKEWVVISPGAELDWLALAREAMAFVGSRSRA